MTTAYAQLPTDTEPMRDANPRQFVGLDCINHADRLYVISHGGYYSCLGFDVLQRKYGLLFDELARCEVGGRLTDGLPRPESLAVGTHATYAAWERLKAAALAHHRRTGYRFGYELTPQLCGLEGCRVEVVDREGDTPRRFNVGRSMGWTPCHIELANVRSTGRCSAMSKYHSVRVVRRIK